MTKQDKKELEESLKSIRNAKESILVFAAMMEEELVKLNEKLRQLEKGLKV